MRHLFFFLFVFFGPLFAHEEILVRLSSKESLHSLYLHIPSVDSSYIKQLEEVLRFDLNHNGKTEITDPSKEGKRQIERENSLLVFDRERWRELGVEYVVKGEFSTSSAALSIFSTNTGTIKQIEKVPLTGNLAKDRRLIHQLSDALHETLFGIPGIASSHILYTNRIRPAKEATQWITEIWEADYDGKNARQVTHDGYLCLNPTYVPPAKGSRSHHLLFVSYKIGQPKIYAAPLHEGVGRRLTYLRGNQLMPSLSPKSDKMAFISDIGGNPDLFVQDFSLEEGLIGKPQQIFSAPQAAQGTPTFSPDGHSIAFVSNKDGTARIYVLEIPPIGASIKDLKPVIISKQNRNNTSPAWSPDGTKIAYSSASLEGVRQIWMYDFKTGRETQLTDGPGHKENPTWAPNSLHLLFNSSTTTSESELYLINLKQKKAVKITSGSGEKRFPAWEPCKK